MYIFFYYRVLKRLSESEIQNKDILEERSLNLKFKIIFYMKWNFTQEDLLTVITHLYKYLQKIR